MERHRAWLPESALFDGKLEGAFSEAANSELAKWFPQPLRLTTLFSRSFKQRDWAGPILSWSPTAEKISSLLDNRGWRLLIGELLGLSVGKRRITEQDRKAGNLLVDKFMQDACNFVQDFFGLGEQQWNFAERRGETRPAADGSCFFSLIWPDGTPLCHIVVSEQLVVRARQELSGAQISDQADVQPREQGLAHQSVSVGALTGKAQLPLLDLEGLAVGDVVVLDQSLSQPLSATVNGLVCEGLSGQLRRANNSLVFEVLEQDESAEYV